MRVGKFTEIYSDVTKNAKKIPQEKYLVEGEYPIIDQGRQNIAGRWNSGEGVFTDVPAIIFGDHTRAIKYIDEPFFIGADGVKVLRPTNAEDNPKYLYYALQAAKIPDLGYSRHFKALKELNIRLFARYEQDRIVKIFENVDCLIDKYEAEKRSLEHLVKSQFIEMFGDPVSNPMGWKKIKVRDAVKEGYIARPLDGNHGEKHPKGSDYVEKGVPFLMAQDLKDKHVDFSNCHFITEEQAKTLRKGWAKTGDVLLTHKGTIGRVAVVQPSEYEDMLLTPQITYYRCLRDLNNEYLAAYFTTDFFVRQMTNMITGATRASVTITQQEELELIIPPMDMQQRFVAFVNQTDKSKFAIKQSLGELETLKKSLMQQYFG